MNSIIHSVAARLAGWIDSYVSAGAVVRALQDGRKPDPDHLRIVFLPNTDDLKDAMSRIGRFLESYRHQHGVAPLAAPAPVPLAAA